MNPRAPHRIVHFGEVDLTEVFDLRSFHLTSDLRIDPLLSDHEHASEHTNAGHHGHASHADDVKSFVFRSERAFDASRLERFMGKLADEHGEDILRYKGILRRRGRRGR